MIEQIADCGERFNDALVACNLSVFDRHVEVTAYQNAAALHGDVFDVFFVVHGNTLLYISINLGIPIFNLY